MKIATKCFALLLLAPLAADPGVARSPAAVVAKTIPVKITTAHGAYRFNVEVATTAAEQERGLMFRHRLSARRGMIFPMDPPRPSSFWMKNTLIPLDIIFIRPDATIVRIAASAQPESLTLIDSGEPVAAVLEVAGGRAKALGIHADDRVSWKLR